MEKFKNRYRIPSARAQWWNYGWDAAYYVTICTKHRKKYLGEIKNEQSILSEVGKIADCCWRDIPNHGKNIELGVYVIMPNHVHGILILDSNPEPDLCLGNWVGDKACLVSTQGRSIATVGQSRFQNPGRNTLSSIVGGFKSAVSKSARKSQLPFGWQSRFHDHIIRNEEEYHRISEYILNNPANWENDHFFEP